MRKVTATKAEKISPNGYTVIKMVVGDVYSLPDDLAHTVVELMKAGVYTPRRAEVAPAPSESVREAIIEPSAPAPEPEKEVEPETLSEAELREAIEKTGASVGKSVKRPGLLALYRSVVGKE